MAMKSITQSKENPVAGKVEPVKAKDIHAGDLIVNGQAGSEPTEVEEVQVNGYERVIKFVDGEIRRVHHDAVFHIHLED